jgi:hypothetical protein
MRLPRTPTALAGPLLLLVLGTHAPAQTPPAKAGRELDLFTPSFQCAVCHTGAPGANAMRSPTGDDVSPYELWHATMMGNAFRDPYFRAQLQKETAAHGAEVQELCLRCHAPMAHHHAVLNGRPAPRLHDLTDDLLADDGVSCTMCHQIMKQDLGDAQTFSGRPHLGTNRQIFGPFADVLTAPMQGQVRYTPTQGLHIRQSALCGTCHTLITEHQGKPFAEQTPYLEWRNSEFSDEDGRTDTSRTCQECHMAKTGATRIARNPNGFDFVIPVRPDFAAHAFVGGNAFMLDLLREHRQELDVKADAESLARMAAATRRQLAEDTARLSIHHVERRDGFATFQVRVENLTGHRFPTGYPARRAFLQVEVRRGGTVVFESGNADGDGRLATGELDFPHVNLVEKPEDLVVYEMVAVDPDGAPTTHLVKMTSRRKDNRLLPRGWKCDGPHAADTAPVGTEHDPDFGAGGDTVSFRVPLPDGSRGRLRVTATLRYQAIPPAWVDALRAVDAEECRTFVRLYDGADQQPETVAVAVATEQ